MSKLSKIDRAIIHAAERGYTARNDGTIVSPSGHVRTCYVKQTSKSNYAHCTFNVRFRGEVIPVPMARFAAYKHFGAKALGGKLVVRHLNDKSMDNRRSNMKLGTRSENAQDAVRLRKRGKR